MAKHGSTPAVNEIPVCNSKGSMNLHISNILSEILEPLAQCQTGSTEVCSSEAMLAELHHLNEELVKLGPQPQRDRLALVGADAEALYPNLRKEESAQVVAEEFL